MAVKSKKETKVVEKTESTETGVKRKSVTFSEKETVKAKPAKKKAKKVTEVVEEEKVQEVVVEEEEEEEEEQNLDDVEDLTEEQEEALRKQILGDLQSSDEDDSSEEEEDTIGKNESMVILDEEQMKKSKEETKKSFDKKAKKASKKAKADEEERGVIYLGRIPHGFYEDEMRGYFTQFGNITKLRLSRSKKTGNSKHYAYIEFESADVARIVAETMNNYLLFEKMLKCVVIPPEQVHPKLFSGANKKYKHFNWSAHNRKMTNKSMSPEELKVKQAKITKGYAKKQKALKDAGFDYEIPEFN